MKTISALLITVLCFTACSSRPVKPASSPWIQYLPAKRTEAAETGFTVADKPDVFVSWFFGLRDNPRKDSAPAFIVRARFQGKTATEVTNQTDSNQNILFVTALADLTEKALKEAFTNIVAHDLDSRELTVEDYVQVASEIFTKNIDWSVLEWEPISLSHAGAAWVFVQETSFPVDLTLKVIERSVDQADRRLIPAMMHKRYRPPWQEASKVIRSWERETAR